jgi:KUP system potassium uptake protein
VDSLGQGFWRVALNFGFMEHARRAARAASSAPTRGWPCNPFETSYFLSRETVVPTRGGAWRWRERLFAAMSRNAGSVATFFRLPDNAVVELGTRVQI